MKQHLAAWAVLVAGLFLVSNTSFAHHGTPLYYGTGSVTLKGTITEFAYANPHAQIYFDVKDDKGSIQHWAAELASPGKIARVGFTRDSLKPGDQVTITLHPSKSGDPVGSFVKVVLADGKELPIRTGGGGGE